MVQYKGYVSESGELVVNLDGNEVSLREFLIATRIAGTRSSKGASERRRAGQGTVAAAK